LPKNHKTNCKCGVCLAKKHTPLAKAMRKKISNTRIKLGLSKGENNPNFKWGNILTKEFLIKEYIINKKSENDIKRQILCGGGTIGLYLRKYHIFLHSNKETQRIKEKNRNKKPENIKKLKYLAKGKKVCFHCGKLKLISEFPKHYDRRDGLLHICKICFANERKIFYNYPKEIYRHLAMRVKNKQVPKKILTRKKFLNWYNNQERKCHYCNRTIEDVRKNSRETNNNHATGRLSIDRKNNKRGYVLNNIVLACFRCNNTKGSYFTEKEFLKLNLPYKIK